ncbi:transketolase C-terminal domain-containing protein [Rhizobium sp. Leaf262]|uniref:transketolase family protein n=1 Tax=Rhizobium sp. Leaf262 TaxID=1736312 RepID=UPI00071614B8|nr:transketolase C-terminal domain-containing protein [Rhizobium sp. Leaf262]KQO79767.1 transketolase [Rhizobium sp. Leaf262]
MTEKAIAMRDALLMRIWQAMSMDEKIFFTCADFGSPVLDKIREDFPSRFVNVGIAEQNLINISAGLALEGYKVFAYAIAPFITMRCFEQLRVSLALLSEVRPMNVNLIGVGAGYSYVVSGPTHQCYEDITLMRALPNFRVLSSSDHVTAAAFFDVCSNNNGPKYMRFDAQVLPVIYTEELGAPDMSAGYRVLREGSGICMISTGYMSHTAMKVADRLKEIGIDATLIDLFNITGFDQSAVIDLISAHKGLVTLEEGFRGRGGVDSMFFEIVSRGRLDVRQLNIGVEGGYRFELGTRFELHEQVGIGENAVYDAIRDFAATL